MLFNNLNNSVDENFTVQIQTRVNKNCSHESLGIFENQVISHILNNHGKKLLSQKIYLLKIFSLIFQPDQIVFKFYFVGRRKQRVEPSTKSSTTTSVDNNTTILLCQTLSSNLQGPPANSPLINGRSNIRLEDQGRCVLNMLSYRFIYQKKFPRSFTPLLR